MLCDDSDIAELQAFGPTIDIRTFPSLTNGGDVARIEDTDGNLIHEVIYEKSWYGDTSKDDGGYTLELINPNDPCLAASNWMASNSSTGATPAAENSGWMPSQPTPGLVALSAAASATEITINFDRLPGTSLSEMDFSLFPTSMIIDIESDEDDPRTVILTLADMLTPGTVYTLTVDGAIADCLPYGMGDLLINEILFNPVGSESDYVELYNNSDKFIDISQLMIGNFDPDGSGSDRSISIARIIEPGEYLVLTENKAALIERYPEALPLKILEIDLPSFNNADGNVTIFLEENGERIIVDQMDYDEDMHNAFIDDEEGVSLERVNPTISSAERSNWKSSAASKGYGTPTLPNSQSDIASNPEGESVFLRSKTFFPERQTDDQLEIVFAVDRSDYLGTLDVYDSAGSHVQQLASNQLIGQNDLYTWDGRDASGVLGNAGVYIIVVRLFTADGSIIMKKLPCVLSRSI